MDIHSLASRWLGKYGYYILILPLLYLLLYFYTMQANGPFFLTRIDPDYAYLMNGLNSAVLRYNRIGHVDHPGTPLQVFLGICIDFIYLLKGHGNLIDDVLARPEFYLRNCSHLLAIAFAIILVWAGKIGSSVNFWGVILLQLTPFLSGVIPDLGVRIMADRFGFMLVFLTCIILIRSLLAPTQFKLRTVITLGLLTGISIATKITFVPLFVLVFVTLNLRINFLISTLAGFFLGILPILNRFRDFKFFLGKVVTHDGIYGSGNERVFEWKVLFQNFKNLINLNSLLYICFLLAVVILITKLWSRSKWDAKMRFVLGFILTVLVASIMVSKHFKNYYIINALILIGPFLFMIFEMGSSKSWKYPILIIAFIFSAQTIQNELRIAKIKIQKVDERKKDQEILNRELKDADHLIIKPEWIWGPAPEYGLVFGLTYVRHRQKYSDFINNHFDKILSFEGPNKDLMRMRTVDIELGNLEGKSVLIVDQKGRPSEEMIKYFENHFQMIKEDSIPMYTDNKLIKLQLGAQKILN